MTGHWTFSNDPAFHDTAPAPHSRIAPGGLADSRDLPAPLLSVPEQQIK